MYCDFGQKFRKVRIAVLFFYTLVVVRTEPLFLDLFQQGVLLYGPPGTGKTLLARAVAHHTECTFIRVSGSELVQKFIGEGSRMVRELFVMARCVLNPSTPALWGTNVTQSFLIDKLFFVIRQNLLVEQQLWEGHACLELWEGHACPNHYCTE